MRHRKPAALPHGTLPAVPFLAWVLACVVACATPATDDATAPVTPPVAAPAVAAPWPPQSYVCRRTDVPVVVDGRIVEAAWRSAPWTTDFVDIQGDLKPLPRLRTRAKMLWDDEFFYVAAELEETDVWAKLVERDSVIYQDNDFEVFIDPDGDTHMYAELEINAFGTEWDLLLVKPYRDGGPALHDWDMPGLKTAVLVDGTLNQAGDVDRGWTVEIAIPWHALRPTTHVAAPPGHGDVWRVNFSRVQWHTRVGTDGYEKVRGENGKPLPEDNWVWSPQGAIAMHQPETWGVVRFAAGEEDAGDGARDLADEARWAMRRVYHAQRAFRQVHGRWARSADELDLGDAHTHGFAWPPEVNATATLWEAWTALDDGRVVRITADGRCSVSAAH